MIVRFVLIQIKVSSGAVIRRVQIQKLPLATMVGLDELTGINIGQVNPLFVFGDTSDPRNQLRAIETGVKFPSTALIFPPDHSAV
jgi:hypothetical protein